MYITLHDDDDDDDDDDRVDIVDWNGYEARETPLLYVFVDRLKAFLSFWSNVASNLWTKNKGLSPSGGSQHKLQHRYVISDVYRLSKKPIFFTNYGVDDVAGLFLRPQPSNNVPGT